MHQIAERNRLRIRIEINALVQKTVARGAGLSESMMSKRMNGDVPFSELEVERIDRTINEMTAEGATA